MQYTKYEDSLGNQARDSLINFRLDNEVGVSLQVTADSETRNTVISLMSKNGEEISTINFDVSGFSVLELDYEHKQLVFTLDDGTQKVCDISEIVDKINELETTTSTLDTKIEDEETRAKGVEQELSGDITDVSNSLSAHKVANNPHNITKSTINLGNVDNTSDLDKPVSTATQQALDNLQLNIDDKVDKKPDGVNYLIVGNKISDSYISDDVKDCVKYKGDFTSEINLPSNPEKGDYYVYEDDRSTVVGEDVYFKNDWAVFNGTVWQKINNNGSVVSVNGKTGVVVLNKDDIGLDNVDNTSDLDKPVSTATQNALNTKQNVLSFDTAPVQGSTNPVTSGGIYNAMNTKQDNLSWDTAPVEGSTNPVTSGGIYNALGSKQSILTFDETPIDGSTNPVTSNGIYDSLQQRVSVVPNGTDSFFVGDKINTVYLKDYIVNCYNTKGLFGDTLPEFPSEGDSYMCVSNLGTEISGTKYYYGDIIIYVGKEIDGQYIEWLKISNNIQNYIPAGGNTRQVLTKASSSSFDLVWANVSGGEGGGDVPSGGEVGQVLTKTTEDVDEYIETEDEIAQEGKTYYSFTPVATEEGDDVSGLFENITISAEETYYIPTEDTQAIAHKQYYQRNEVSVIVGETVVSGYYEEHFVQGITSWENAGTPEGGVAGNILIKKSSTDYDAEWQAPADEVVSGNNKPVTSDAVYNKISEFIDSNGNIISFEDIEGSEIFTYIFNDGIDKTATITGFNIPSTGKYKESGDTLIPESQSTLQRNTEYFYIQEVINVEPGVTDVTGYYEIINSVYTLTSDTVAIEGKTYYEKLEYWLVGLPSRDQKINIIPKYVRENNVFYRITSLKKKDSSYTGAFENYLFLDTITISDTIKEIGDYAFAGCTNLGYIDFGNGVERIEDSAFLNCTNLGYDGQVIIINDNITNIANNAFSDCSNITSMIVYSKNNSAPVGKPWGAPNAHIQVFIYPEDNQVVPPGGTEGQVLTRVSGGATDWTTVSGGGGSKAIEFSVIMNYDGLPFSSIKMIPTSITLNEESGLTLTGDNISSFNDYVNKNCLYLYNYFTVNAQTLEPEAKFQLIYGVIERVTQNPDTYIFTGMTELAEEYGMSIPEEESSEA